MGDLAVHRVELIVRGGGWVDQPPQTGLVGIARHHVHMQVEHLLAGHRPRGGEQVDAVGVEPLDQSRATVSMAGAISVSAGSPPTRSGTCRRGTTRAWPRCQGLTSRKAYACSSEYTPRDGMSPLMILQKMQSVIG